MAARKSEMFFKTIEKMKRLYRVSDNGRDGRVVHVFYETGRGCSCGLLAFSTASMLKGSRCQEKLMREEDLDKPDVRHNG